MNKLLDVSDLRVDFATYGGTVKAVRGVSFSLEQGECLCLVGESGCGKSVTSLGIMRLIPTPPGRMSGRVLFGGRDLLSLNEREMNRIRGAEISMIFQDPMTSLNPTMSVGRQIEEVLREHERVSKSEARRRTIETLDLVGIPEPAHRFDQYPHEFSGGMRQRVLIAAAMICNPKLLIADEPTTALDVTIQAQVLDLMRNLQRRFSTATLLITHDLGVVANMAHRIAVIYAGRIVETGKPEEIFRRPAHPYTRALLCSVPRLDRTSHEPLCSIEGTPPDLFSPPPGCGFRPRCEFAMRVCDEPPPFFAANGGSDHASACWLLHEKARRRSAASTATLGRRDAA